MQLVIVMKATEYRRHDNAMFRRNTVPFSLDFQFSNVWVWNSRSEA
jgi:hypothetical protein